MISWKTYSSRRFLCIWEKANILEIGKNFEGGNLRKSFKEKKAKPQEFSNGKNMKTRRELNGVGISLSKGFKVGLYHIKNSSKGLILKIDFIFNWIYNGKLRSSWSLAWVFNRFR